MGGGVRSRRSSMENTLDITELMEFDKSVWKDVPCEGKDGKLCPVDTGVVYGSV